MKSTIANVILILLLIITGQVFASTTYFSIQDNCKISYIPIDNTEILIYAPHLNNYNNQWDNITDRINNAAYINNNIRGLRKIPEPNTIILGGIGTFLVIWLKRSGLL